MTGLYDLKLVALSVIVAIIASYTALELAGHLSQKRGKSSWSWLVGGAISMGTGIWSMHFIGMLAFHLPVAVAYDAAATMLSMAIAIVISGLALFVVRRPALTGRNITAGATLMGFGISAMHYMGMHAMRMSPPIEYHPPLFIASVIIAIVASFAALWIAFQLRHNHFGAAFLAKLGSAAVMGLAITGMHYTGMAAAQFAPDSICLAIDSTDGMESAALALSIGIATICILAITLGVSALDAHLIAQRKRGEEELRRFGAAMDTIADAIYLVDRSSMCFVHVNDAACRMQNQPREQLLGFDPARALSTSRAELERTYDAVIANGVDAKPLEIPRLREDGSQGWVELRHHAQHSGDRWMIVTLVRDVTERKTAQDRIVHLNRVYAVLSQINALIVRVRDRDELFREACRIAVEQGGFRMSLIAMLDGSAMKIVPVATAGQDEELMTAIKALLSSTEGSPNTMVARAISQKKVVVSDDSKSDGGVPLGRKYAECGVRSVAILPLIVSDEAVGVLALYATEIDFFHQEELKLLTELAGDIAFAIDHIDKQERLDYLAYYDALTGLANRSLFLERLAQYMRSADGGGHKLALYLIDLERFKNINDSLGRPAGDALLKQVAEWLTRNLGDANLLARFDADHFAVVLPEVKQEGDVARLLEKTMAAFLERPFHLGDSVFRIAAKVGIALFPDDGNDATTLLQNAEAALKKAKASGDRYLFYAQKMTATVAGTLTLENQLRQALDRGEFVLHYQPKVNLVSGKLTGAEALIRWNDPRTGLVPPGRFIPVLEETGLIYEVGRWALRQAVEDHLRWRTAGLAAVRVAVNVSPLQLRNRGFIAEIRQVIGIDAQAAAGLELEITESLIMEDTKNSIASLQAIRAAGVSIAIDDFGTGFSSLSYLSKLPVDTLKIDRSFVNDITAGPEGLALVSTIINLAHSLKLKVVAEGVETEEQSRLLRLLACDEMQGFLFSKPVPSEIFESRFLARLPARDDQGTSEAIPVT